MWKWLKRYAAGEAPPKPSEADASEPQTILLTDPALIANFKNRSRALRAEKPVCPVSGGGVLLLLAEDVKSAFSNPALSNQPSRFSALAPKNKGKYVAASVAANILPFLDAPRHVTLRKWAGQAFFKHFQDFEGQIAPIADNHCSGLGQEPQLLVEDVARKYVVDVIGKFVGIDVSPDDMKRSTSALFRLFAPAADAETFAKTNTGLSLARQQLSAALAARRADNEPCLLNALDASYPSDLPDTDRELLIIDNALLFLADGVENVEAAIGMVMMQHARSGAEITQTFVRQAIAADTPGQTIARVATQDMLISDVQVKAGTPVFLSLASANDSAAGTDDFTFGRGRHKCIGEHLAIAMVTAMCQGLAAHQPKIDVSHLTFRGMFGHKWPRHIYISKD